jgi:hypothetical protein
MDYDKDIEPIHELPGDELEHFLNLILEELNFLWSHTTAADPTEQQAVDRKLNTLIHSVKKSLLDLYKDRRWEYIREDLQEVVNSNEAEWFLYEMELTGTRNYPLNEGVKVLSKIYSQLGPHYPCEPENMGAAIADFQDMAHAVKEYAAIAKEYFFKRREKGLSKELSEVTTAREADRPLIEEGEKRRKQVTAPRDKKNKTLKKAVNLLMSKRTYQSAMHLMTSFPEIEKPLEIDGRKIFKESISEDPDDVMLKIIIVEPDGKRKTFRQRAFQKYYNEAKKLAR